MIIFCFSLITIKLLTNQHLICIGMVWITRTLNFYNYIFEINVTRCLTNGWLSQTRVFFVVFLLLTTVVIS